MIFNFEIKEYFDRVEAVCENFAQMSSTAYDGESIRDNIITSIFSFFEISLNHDEISKDTADLTHGDMYSIDCGDLLEPKDIH